MSFGFFHESVSPRPLSIPLGLIQIFTKICGDIHNFVFIAGVVKGMSVTRKRGGSRRWQMIGIGLRPRRSRFVCLIILLSLILCISVSAPVKLNE